MNSSKLNAIVTNLLEQYLADSAWEAARQLANDDRFKSCCQEDGSEILNLLMFHLKHETFTANPELYQTAEVLVKATAEHANAQDMVMEFMDRLDRVDDDNVLISLMKGLQVVLLRLPERKSLSIEWCLTPLVNYVKRMPVPDHLHTTIVPEKLPFLESDPLIDRILQLHLILLLFLEPIVQQIVANRSQEWTTRSLENTRQNVLIHVLLNLLDTHLNRIYVPYNPHKETNTYIRQCREQLSVMLTQLLGSDPFYLLPFIERRICYPIKVDDDDTVTDMKKTNVFIVANKTTILSYGHYFHTFLVHELATDDMPKIYKGDYVWAKFMYLVTEMVKSEDQNVQMKGIEMGQKLLQVVNKEDSNGDRRSDEYLELIVFESFFERMIQLMTYSESEMIRKTAVKYTETLIMSFNDRGRMIILENLFKEYAENKGLSGYLPILYKNMVVEELNRKGEGESVAAQYSGPVFHKMLLKYICKLAEGEKTNILDCSDRILAALNLIRFIVLRDRSNRTSFWDIRKELEEHFLDKLRLAIDLSRAHYEHYKKNIEEDKEIEEDQTINLSMYGMEMPELSKEQKLLAMNNCLNSFDLMDSLLARVNDCIQAAGREFKP